METQVDTLPLEAPIISLVFYELNVKEKVEEEEIGCKAKSKNVKCYRCGQQGHYAFECSSKRIKMKKMHSKFQTTCDKGKEEGKIEVHFSSPNLNFKNLHDEDDKCEKLILQVHDSLRETEIFLYEMFFEHEKMKIKIDLLGSFFNFEKENFVRKKIQKHVPLNDSCFTSIKHGTCFDKSCHVEENVQCYFCNQHGHKKKKCYVKRNLGLGIKGK